MKKLFLSFLFASLFALPLFSNGIIIVDTEEEIYLTLVASSVETQVSNQVAITKATQTFLNQTGSLIESAKYAFPLLDGASATALRWFVNGQWYQATISAEPQDTSITGGGSGASQALLDFLGDTPLFFNLDPTSIGPEATIVMELTYVELLPYSFSKVTYAYPGDYSLIQPGGQSVEQSFSWLLESERTILSVAFPGFPSGDIDVADHEASVNYEALALCDADFEVFYELSSDELGVLSMSTFIDDSLLLCDSHGKGFLALIVEPESNPNVEVIEKNFVLVVDRSGSMSGGKIIQARDAASFIVQHLNPGDHFNLIDFDNEITLLFPELAPFNVTSMNAAMNHISALTADGSTNISGALTTAIGQFGAADPGKANIILFFTDGQPTAGITSTDGILNAVETSVSMAETTIFLYCFGIGSDVNYQLLAALAEENNGQATFLENDELEAVITEFFLQVNNPLLLSPQVVFDPPVITQLYPPTLPNLYKGQQLIIAGRYQEATTVNMQLTGTAFSIPLTYNFTIDLPDTLNADFFFLPKVWAKKKIEYLQQQYYLAGGPGSPAAEAIEDEAIAISTCYGVISDFTSFTGPPLTYVEEVDSENPALWTWEALPNPFQEKVTFRIELPFGWDEQSFIFILDGQGRIIAILPANLGPAGVYEIAWDASRLPKGVYFAALSIGNDWNVLTLMKN